MSAYGVLAQPSGEQLSGLAGWVADVVAALGSAGVGALVLLETVFPPVPSEVVLPLAGYLASQDRLSLIGALVGSTLGAVLGALLLYWLGAKLGQERTDALLARVPLLDRDDVDRAHGWFERHGDAAVFLGRMVPGVRSIISLPAGVDRMPVWRFCGYTGAGSLLWNLGLVGAGWALGRQWRNVGAYSGYINYALIAGLLIAVARFVWKRRDRLRSRARTSG